MQKKTLLAVRIEPWQLFRFKQWVQYRKSRPSIIIQEALQTYFSTLALPRELLDEWLKKYHKENY